MIAVSDKDRTFSSCSAGWVDGLDEVVSANVKLGSGAEVGFRGEKCVVLHFCLTPLQSVCVPNNSYGSIVSTSCGIWENIFFIILATMPSSRTNTASIWVGLLGGFVGSVRD